MNIVQSNKKLDDNSILLKNSSFIPKFNYVYDEYSDEKHLKHFYYYRLKKNEYTTVGIGFDFLIHLYLYSVNEQKDFIIFDEKLTNMLDTFSTYYYRYYLINFYMIDYYKEMDLYYQVYKNVKLDTYYKFEELLMIRFIKDGIIKLNFSLSNSTSFIKLLAISYLKDTHFDIQKLFKDFNNNLVSGIFFDRLNFNFSKDSSLIETYEMYDLFKDKIKEKEINEKIEKDKTIPIFLILDYFWNRYYISYEFTLRIIQKLENSGILIVKDSSVVYTSSFDINLNIIDSIFERFIKKEDDDLSELKFLMNQEINMECPYCNDFLSFDVDKNLFCHSCNIIFNNSSYNHKFNMFTFFNLVKNGLAVNYVKDDNKFHLFYMKSKFINKFYVYKKW
jgi:hypothetical protein